MGESEELEAEEVAVLPVDVERGLALVVGAAVTDVESWQMPQGLVADALNLGGLLGGAGAANALRNSSIVTLAHETVARLN
jgi:hypothetical protein